MYRSGKSNGNGVSVIILSAGKSSRMNSNTQKIFHNIGGIPIFVHVVRTSLSLSPEQIVIVISPYMQQKMQELLGEYLSAAELELISFATQEKPTGTATAAIVGIEKLKNKNKSTVIMCADAPLVKKTSLEKALHFVTSKKDSRDLIACLCFQAHKALGYGRVIPDSHNSIKTIIEYTEDTIQKSDKNIYNSGSIVGNSDTILTLLKKVDNNNSKKEYYLTNIVHIAPEKTVYPVFIKQNESIGVNSRRDLAKCEYLFQQRMRQKFFNNGVTLLDPKTAFFSYDTEIYKDSVIYPNVFFGLKVKLLENVTILPFSHLSYCTIKSGSIIGSFAVISDDTIIGEESVIGNFVEVKRSNIGNKTKAKHLSYLGDTEIGEGSNIGAGTVFCNYNGHVKSASKVGKRCFIGANNSIIAPVEIGDEAKTAAGSVIHKDIPNQHKVTTKPEQLNLKRQSITDDFSSKED